MRINYSAIFFLSNPFLIKLFNNSILFLHFLVEKNQNFLKTKKIRIILFVKYFKGSIIIIILPLYSNTYSNFPFENLEWFFFIDNNEEKTNKTITNLFDDLYKPNTNTIIIKGYIG